MVVTWFGQRSRHTRFSHRSPGRVGGVCVFRHEIVKNVNTLLTCCAGLLNQVHLPDNSATQKRRAFIVGIPTEMFGD